ncbi:uncharacterized protein LOC135352442 isoform X2 [Halichondria panicea]|uniref:uncharacterized protein LOC135352442 isoform X2 n=1 Tax=Halichondria panicea TaxID=6063 RepID=UPI00312B4F0A
MTRLGAAIYWLALSLTLQINVLSATFLVSDERPCPMERVTFTCTAPGANLRWSLSDVASNIDVHSEFTPLNTPLMPVQGYTVTRIALNNAGIASTLSRIAEDGVMVTCLNPNPSNEIGSATIQLAVPPSPPQRVGHSVDNSSADGVSVTVQWDPPTETGGRDDLTYTVTISPPAQLSATVLTSTSVTMTAQYNVNYTVSVVDTNCAGNSTTAEYSFRIGGCPELTNPTNRTFGPVSSRLPGSTVTIQCDKGYVSPVTMVTCDDGTLLWSPSSETIMCGQLQQTQAPPTTALLMRCTAQLDPPRNGTIISDHFLPAIPGTQVSFQCDNGLFPEGISTSTCLATGDWDRNPGEIVCRVQSPSIFTGTDLGIAVSVSVIITAALFIIIGFLTGLLVIYLRYHKKAAHFPAAEGQGNARSTAPVGPVYEEVSPKEEIELNTNQAYGPL